MNDMTMGRRGKILHLFLFFLCANGESLEEEMTRIGTN